jgi:uncharacterized caspase-like protein
MTSIHELTKKLIGLVLFGLTYTAGLTALAQVPFGVVSQSPKTGLSYNKSAALIIYVSDYKIWPPLRNTKAEADDLRKVLEKQGFIVKVLPDPHNRVELESEINSFAADYAMSRAYDRVLIYFAGHGLARRNIGFLVPSDAPKPVFVASSLSADSRFYKETLKMNSLYYNMKDYRSKHVLLVLDTCSSGSIFGHNTKPAQSVARKNVDEAFRQDSRQVLTAGFEDEEVPGKSIFTPLFLEAIEGKADSNQDAVVTVTEVYEYIRRNLPLRKTDKKPQTPQYGEVDIQDGIPQDTGDMLFFSKSSTNPTEKPIPGEVPSSNGKPAKEGHQVDTELQAKLRRSRYKVQYFGKVNDGHVVSNALRKLGFTSTLLPSENRLELSDTIWVGGKVDIEDAKLLAYILIQDGVKLKAIKTFEQRPDRDPSQMNIIQIGADGFLPKDCKPLRIEQIASANRFDRSSLVCRR